MEKYNGAGFVMNRIAFYAKTLAGLLLFFCVVQTATASETLRKTPFDQQGPYYPVTAREDIDFDLTRVKGRDAAARGEILHLSGVVVNTAGKAQENVIIEIWQTDPQGRYDHPGDPSHGARDPDFQYWGAVRTGADGTFYFKTLIPGGYEPRPPHIHFKVLREGRAILTSQIYFKKGADSSPPDLQTAVLQQKGEGEYATFFRIVI
jgi:protocatechuate 3,4-dioxygenase beta subunit